VGGDAVQPFVRPGQPPHAAAGFRVPQQGDAVAAGREPWLTAGGEPGDEVDGRDLVIPGHEKGHFLGPTIVDNVPLESSLYTEEVFGPVLAIVHADTYEEAIKQVNSSPFGNGAAIFTNDGGVARRFELDVEAGMVGVNVPIPTPVAYYSFGGWKDLLKTFLHSQYNEDYPKYEKLLRELKII